MHLRSGVHCQGSVHPFGGYYLVSIIAGVKLERYSFLTQLKKSFPGSSLTNLPERAKIFERYLFFLKVFGLYHLKGF